MKPGPDGPRLAVMLPAHDEDAGHPPSDGISACHDLTVWVDPDGNVTVPDLADGLLPLVRDLNARFSPEPVPLDSAPVLATTRRTRICVAREDIPAVPVEGLWAAHDEADDDAPCANGATLLDVKAELARRMLSSCALCEARCGVDRLAGERGRCGVGTDLHVMDAFPNMGEERELGRPTYTVFLSGCNLRCVTCYRGDALRASDAARTAPADAPERIFRPAAASSQSLHYLGGNPDQHLCAILAAHAAGGPDLPIVWNSNMLMTPPALRLLDGVVDIFVADLKFGNDECAAEIAGARDYWPSVTRNLSAVPPRAQLIVRHLLLPGHTDCCARPVADFVAQALPHAKVSLQVNYQPPANLRGELVRRIRPQEAESARALFRSRGVPLVANS